jgi:hypothetical protein
MTSLELQREFERLLYARNKVFETIEKPDTETIFGFLTIAQLRLLKQKYIPTASTEDNIKSIQANSEDLKNLIVFDTISPVAPITPYSTYTYDCTFPIDYLHYIRSDTNGIIDSVTSQLPNKLVSWSEMNKVITNIYNIPIIRKPFVTLMDSKFLLTTDKYTTPVTVILTYLKKPLDITISQTSELAEYLHEDIAQLAVSIFEQQRLTANEPKGNA